MKIPNPPPKPHRHAREQEFRLKGLMKLGDFFNEVREAGISIEDLVFNYYDEDFREVVFSATIVESNSEFNPRYQAWEKAYAEWEAKWGAAYKKQQRDKKLAEKEARLKAERKDLEDAEARLKAQLEAINKKKAKL